MRKIVAVAVIFTAIILLSETVLADVIMLQWDSPNGATNLAGYKVYWGTSSRNYTNSKMVSRCNACPNPTGVVVDWECLALQPYTTYYFAVTAFDTSGRESGYSNEVSTTTRPATNPIGNIDTVSPGSQCRVDGYDLISLNKVFGASILDAGCTEPNYRLWKDTQRNRADLNYDGRISGVDQSILTSPAVFGKKCSTCPCQ